MCITSVFHYILKISKLVPESYLSLRLVGTVRLLSILLSIVVHYIHSFTSLSFQIFVWVFLSIHQWDALTEAEPTERNG